MLALILIALLLATPVYAQVTKETETSFRKPKPDDIISLVWVKQNITRVDSIIETKEQEIVVLEAEKAAWQKDYDDAVDVGVKETEIETP